MTILRHFSFFSHNRPDPHPHADFYALPQEPVAEIIISESGGGAALHNSLQDFSVAEGKRFLWMYWMHGCRVIIGLRSILPFWPKKLKMHHFGQF